MLGVLGLDPLDDVWDDGDRGGDLKPVVDSLVALALEQRAQARSTQGLGGRRLGARPAQERGS